MKTNLYFTREDFATYEAWQKFKQVTPDALDDAFWKDENGNFSFSEEFTGNKVVRVFEVFADFSEHSSTALVYADDQCPACRGLGSPSGCYQCGIENGEY